jgi:hypothetical protein
MTNNDQLLQDLVKILCSIAGATQGVADPENLYLHQLLCDLAQVDRNEPLETQGEQIATFLRTEIAAWNGEISLRGVKLSAVQCRNHWRFLLKLVATDTTTSEDRRRRVIRAIGLTRCKVQNWRKNVEPYFLEPLAAYLIDNYPERVGVAQAA